MRLGPVEIALLVVLALIVFGGTRLAGLGKALGSSIRDFKKEMNKTDESQPQETAADETNSENAEQDKG